MSGTRQATVSDALNEAPLSAFHTKALFTSGMGFFTDAYDLFIIGTVTTLLATQWHLTTSQTGLINSTTLIAAFVGAFVFGRLADVLGRKRIYGLLATIMTVGALASAFAPSFMWLVIFRFVLGIGIGGDYPVSAVIMSEYSNRQNRGRLVGLVFAMQAVGLVVGPIVGITLLGAGVNHDLAWRLMLGLGAIPSAAVIYMRMRMPESPRYLERVRGQSERAVAAISSFSDGTVTASEAPSKVQRHMGVLSFLTTPRYLLYLVGTAGSWFLFDYAYYGNSVSAPLIVKGVLGSGKHPIIQVLSIDLIIFAVAAVPAYYLGAFFMDRIGHKRLQFIGFAGLVGVFLLIGAIPGVTKDIAPFMVLFGLSYFFANFGPNQTTFVLSGEVYPVSQRTTGHGISAGIAKVGAFIGVYLFPVLDKSLGLSGIMLLVAGFSALGFLCTFLVPEPAGRNLEEVSGDTDLELEVVRRAEEIVSAGSQDSPGDVPAPVAEKVS